MTFNDKIFFHAFPCFSMTVGTLILSRVDEQVVNTVETLDNIKDLNSLLATLQTGQQPERDT